ATFYFPVTRAWELMAGAWLAISHKHQLVVITSRPTIQSGIGLGLVALSIAIIRPPGFPGFWALLPVLGTMLIINAGTNSVTTVNHRVLSWRPIVGLGLVSYPLYLWHWVLWSSVIVIFGDVPSINN